MYSKTEISSPTSETQENKNDDEDYEDDKNEDDNNNCTFANILCKQSPSVVSKHWILLDNQSTFNVFQNRDLLTNIRDTVKQMRINWNSGITTTTLMGDLPWYGKVWLHPQGIANILSLARVKENTE